MSKTKDVFAAVRAAARGLAVEESTAYGAPALKVRGKLLGCIATNKAAEPETLVVCVGFDQRDALIVEDPDVYYLKDHYLDSPVVLVKLRRIREDALRSLLREAWEFVNASGKKSPRARAPKPRTRSRGPRH